jgi:phosphonate transport system ATP-binding protein
MRDGRIVFDGAASQLTESAAREIYGAGAEFTESATSTSISALAAHAAAPQSDARFGARIGA